MCCSIWGFMKSKTFFLQTEQWAITCSWPCSYITEQWTSNSSKIIQKSSNISRRQRFLNGITCTAFRLVTWSNSSRMRRQWQTQNSTNTWKCLRSGRSWTLRKLQSSWRATSFWFITTVWANQLSRRSLTQARRLRMKWRMHYNWWEWTSLSLSESTITTCTFTSRWATIA